MIEKKVTRIAPSDISFTANCGHCLWHKYHTGWKNESIFPSVFSLLDINQKNYFNPLGVKEISKDLPEGIVDQKIADKFITSKVFYDNKDRPFRIGGKADLILIFDEGGYGVIDNKTSKVRDNQDYYFHQLECYAQILENPDEETAEKFFQANGVQKYAPVTRMGLSIFEPSKIIDHSSESVTQMYDRKWIPIDRNPKKLFDKITQIMDVIALPEAPPASECSRCKLYVNALEEARK